MVSIEPGHLDLPSARPSPSSESTRTTAPQTVVTLREAVDRYQATLVQSALNRHRGNWAAAARELGIDRGNLRRLAVRLGLEDS